ncbi:hypothetical protein JX265_002723 [Neoarthrinium moseri]|uniref:SnoaL-like domain-containing protein n=1 Tax=Neoarthrinium moseri TaxID=1658444 RepID=A0A9P9WUZ8_9PEZI|nr:uncharacterized protein JN550_000534 [Neoarthrinium moseri]KAI1842672.1 hypothetical protein JX266_011134 [Neoarthrinium moseri]KAI1878352.1 hypothetical protein JN550_000534 [Neoarthrinium moseri]KAI1879769.1 hypothetical protein JX265_002723 [Neoarthrinium moseri]
MSTQITRKEFLEYVRAFNAHDFDKQYSYYDDDVILDLPDPQTGKLRGKKGIMAHYAPLFEVAEEVLVPMHLAVDGDNIFYVMESYFCYNKKLDHGVFGYPVEPGDIIKIRVWAHYQIKNKKMYYITCNLFQKWFLGKVSLKEAVAESRTRADDEFKSFT